MKPSIFDTQPVNFNHPSIPHTHPWKKLTTYATLLLLGAGMGVSGVYLVNSPQLLARTPEIEKTDNGPSLAAIPPQTPSNFIAEVVQEVGPAVVRINASRTVNRNVPDMFRDPLFRDFFGSQVPQVPDKEIQRGTGSGFIISANGQILTNAHVIDGADEVTVTLKDGRTLQGKVLGTDPVTDVAVVKIEAEDLPTIRLGDSDKLEVGQWAIAIGNPLGLDNTVTTGIVSAMGRSSSQVGVGDKRIDFIQTDAAINPGNSGGPLLNDRGEVIGVNTAIIQNAQGIGFAIPINKAQQIAQQLIANGKVEHGYLGIQMVGITPDIKQELQSQKGWAIEPDKGVLIVQVMPNSPADRAGLRSQDIITAVSDRPIDDPNQVQQMVEKTTIGEDLSLTVNRNGQTVNLKVKVGVLAANQ